MRLTRMTDLALRLLMYLGQRPDRLCTIAEVAEAYRVSETHLMKVTHQLGLAGLLATTRGKGGGIRLARPAQEIALGAVVCAVEPDFDVVECFATGHSCTLGGNCAVTGVMQGAVRSFIEHLDRHTLADMLPAAAKGQAVPIRMQRRR